MYTMHISKSRKQEHGIGLIAVLFFFRTNLEKNKDLLVNL